MWTLFDKASYVLYVGDIGTKLSGHGHEAWGVHYYKLDLFIFDKARL
jgi:hypothetical protein